MQALDIFTVTVFPYSWIWFFLLMSIRTIVILRRGYKVELGLAKGSLALRLCI